LILVVSDLHLDFSAAREIDLFFELIRKFSKKADMLIINGDIFDSPSSTCNISRILERLSRLLFKNSKFKKIYHVVGNHDLGLNAFKGSYRTLRLEVCFPQLEFTWSGLKLYFEHGHRFDPLFKYSIYDLMKIIEQRGGFKFGDLAEDFITGFYGHFQTRQQPDFGVPESLAKLWVEEAESIAIARELHLVSFGHTHRKELLRMKKGVYLNTGSFYKQNLFALIDTQKVILYSFKGGKEEVVATAALP